MRNIRILDHRIIKLTPCVTGQQSMFLIEQPLPNYLNARGHFLNNSGTPLALESGFGGEKGGFYDVRSGRISHKLGNRESLACSDATGCTHGLFLKSANERRIFFSIGSFFRACFRRKTLENAPRRNEEYQINLLPSEQAGFPRFSPFTKGKHAPILGFILGLIALPLFCLLSIFERRR